MLRIKSWNFPFNSNFENFLFSIDTLSDNFSINNLNSDFFSCDFWRFCFEHAFLKISFVALIRTAAALSGTLYNVFVLLLNDYILFLVINLVIFCLLISIWVFLYWHSRFTGQQGKGEAISLTTLYHFHPLHRHFNMMRVLTRGNSPLSITSSRTRIGNLCFPSTSC